MASGLGLGCGSALEQASPAPTPSAAADTLAIEIEERWQSEPFIDQNIDSLALAGDGRLYVTAKEGDRLWILDPTSGETVGSLGASGPELGEFERPNGIAAIASMILVVERDNARVQVLSAGDREPFGAFGNGLLRRPYGIAVAGVQGETETIEVWITDQYETADGGVPPLDELDERVKHFRVTRRGDRIEAVHLGTFGDTAGEGVLHKVETVAVDPETRRLLIADELDGRQALVIYDGDGRFVERAAADLFGSEPEGVALYRCAGGGGFWVVTDQHPQRTRFHLLQRDDLAEIGLFVGLATANTDGIAVTDEPFRDFPRGALFAVDDDARVTGFDFEEILRRFDLLTHCSG
jgi:3-phytase